MPERAQPRLLLVVFFVTGTGNGPVHDWLPKLPPLERRIVRVDLNTLQFHWPLGMPLVRRLAGGLYEVRLRLPSPIAPTLFFVDAGDVVLVHGFIKKTQRTPPEDLALAAKRKNAYLQNT